MPSLSPSILVVSTEARTLFQIDVKTGINIEELSTFDSEKEILLFPGLHLLSSPFGWTE